MLTTWGMLKLDWDYSPQSKLSEEVKEIGSGV